VQKEPIDLCKDEAMAEVSLGGDRKGISGRNGDTLRRNALKRVDGAVYGRVISCSRGQERWRTELELCCRESFDNDHRSTAVGAAPYGLGGWCGALVKNVVFERFMPQLRSEIETWH
jgi:hypothetical protein